MQENRNIKIPSAQLRIQSCVLTSRLKGNKNPHKVGKILSPLGKQANLTGPTNKAFRVGKRLGKLSNKTNLKTEKG